MGRIITHYYNPITIFPYIKIAKNPLGQMRKFKFYVKINYCTPPLVTSDLNLHNEKAIPGPIPIISAKIILYYIKQTQQSYPLIQIAAEIQRNVFTETAKNSFKRHNQLNFDCAYTAQ